MRSLTCRFAGPFTIMCRNTQFYRVTMITVSCCILLLGGERLNAFVNHSNTGWSMIKSAAECRTWWSRR